MKTGIWIYLLAGTVTPGKWPQFISHISLLNDGKGQSMNVTQKYSKTFIFCCEWSKMQLGCDGRWIRMRIKDLVVVGEWMPVKIFINKGNRLEDASDKYISFSSSGWWNKILVNDFDNDGDEDIVLGNYGMNGQSSPSETEPVQLYNSDIDGNGKNDPILTSFVQGKSYPFITMDDILFQVPFLRKKFYNYNSYANATINDLNYS